MQVRLSSLLAIVLASFVSLPAGAESAKSLIRHLPQRIAGFAVGTVVGTPISMVRCTKRELIKQTKEAYTLGNVPKPFGYVTAGVFGIPSGIFCGAMYGSCDGAADALVNSINSKEDTPFNKGTFSLDKLVF